MVETMLQLMAVISLQLTLWLHLPIQTWLSIYGTYIVHMNLIAVPWGTTIPWLSHKVEISLNITPISTRRVSIDYIRWAQPPHTSKHKNSLFIIFEEWDDGMLACSHNDLNLANSKVYKDIPIRWLNPWLHEIHAILWGTAIRFIWPNNFH